MSQIELRVAEGVNFPYYVMGRAQLRILPFADPWVWVDPQGDPYALFAQDYGAEITEVGNTEEVWYDWLSQTCASCPDDARESLKHCGGPLLPIARGILPEYLARWPAIREKLTRLLRDGPSEMDLSSALLRNEQLFGLLYREGGREVFHFNHFPTTATQKPGPHFVFGLACLSLPEGHLLGAIEYEVGLTLLEQILKDERVASYRRRAAVTVSDEPDLTRTARLNWTERLSRQAMATGRPSRRAVTVRPRESTAGNSTSRRVSDP